MTRSLLLRLHSYEQTEPPSLHIIEILPNHSSNLFPLSDLINNEERQYKMMSTSRICTFLLLALAAISTSAFVTGKPSAVSTSIPSVTQPTTTSLAERQWNFNEGRAPWGLKKNAEIWNGRVAQVGSHSIIFIFSRIFRAAAHSNPCFLRI